MNFVIIYSLIFSTFSTTVIDQGNCVRLDVEITLDNDNSISGTVQVVGFDFNPSNLKHDTILFHHIKKREKLYLYEQIQCINYPKPNVNYIDNEKYGNLSAAPIEDTKIIETVNIKGVHLLKDYACSCKIDPNQEYYFQGFRSQIISYLTQQEIDQLQNEPISQKLIRNAEGPDYYIIMSYNSNLDSLQINNMYKQFEEEEYPKIKSIEEFRKQGVIVVYNEIGTW